MYLLLKMSAEYFESQESIISSFMTVFILLRRVYGASFSYIQTLCKFHSLLSYVNRKPVCPSPLLLHYMQPKSWRCGGSMLSFRNTKHLD